MKPRLEREVIAMRAAKELKDGDYVNLGIGIPNLCALHIPEGVITEYLDNMVKDFKDIKKDLTKEADEVVKNVKKNLDTD